MVIMKTISVTSFKANCLELLSRVGKTGEPILITKRGKPTAMLVPPPPEGDEKWTLGKHRHTAKVVGDIVAPLDEPWEALR